MTKTIFITGASRGVGKATAKFFASRGWSVIATMRNPENEMEFSTMKNVHLYPLDITNKQQIEKTIQQIIDTHDVDVVLNNAGYGLSGPVDACTDEQITRELNTNLLGTIRVTKEFIPFLKKKRSGIIINITSLAGIIGFPLNSIYNASKWALEGFSESISYELQPYGIKVKTVAPGVVLTDFGRVSLDSVHVEDYDDMMKNYLEYMMSDMSLISSPESVAEIIYTAATDEIDQLRYIAGVDGNKMYAEYQELGNEKYRQMLTRRILPNIK